MAVTQREVLLAAVRAAFERDHADAAYVLEALDPQDAAEIFRLLPTSLMVGIAEHFETASAAAILSGVSLSALVRVVRNLEPPKAALMLAVMDQESRQRVLDELPESTRLRIADALQFPENSAGRMVSLDFLAFRQTLRVRDAIKKIRAAARRTTAPSYVYIIDADNRFVGVVTMRDLLLASGNATLETIMVTDVFAVDAFEDREQVANELSNRHFFAAPVVDRERRLIGVIRTEQLLSDVQEEATEDLQRMFGAGGDERAFSPVGFSLRKRLPWLHVNLATAFLAAAVVGMFEGLIARMTLLAVFLPVVAGQGGNSGAQSLAVVMRGLVLQEIPPQRAWRLIFKETWVGLLNGLVIGGVTAGIAWVWGGSAVLGAVIGGAMLINMIAAGFAGAAIPVGMKGLGLDPSQSSSIILTTITDIVGFFAFLGLASLFEAFL